MCVCHPKKPIVTTAQRSINTRAWWQGPAALVTHTHNAENSIADIEIFATVQNVSLRVIWHHMLLYCKCIFNPSVQVLLYLTLYYWTSVQLFPVCSKSVHSSDCVVCHWSHIMCPLPPLPNLPILFLALIFSSFCLALSACFCPVLTSSQNGSIWLHASSALAVGWLHLAVQWLGFWNLAVGVCVCVCA